MIDALSGRCQMCFDTLSTRHCFQVATACQTKGANRRSYELGHDSIRAEAACNVAAKRANVRPGSACHRQFKKRIFK